MPENNIRKNLSSFTNTSNIFRCAVNFLINGADENIALHFNPRLSERVRNSLRNGVWENEKRNLGFRFHWKRNEKCEVSVSFIV